MKVPGSQIQPRSPCAHTVEYFNELLSVLLASAESAIPSFPGDHVRGLLDYGPRHDMPAVPGFLLLIIHRLLTLADGILAIVHFLFEAHRDGVSQFVRCIVFDRDGGYSVGNVCVRFHEPEPVRILQMVISMGLRSARAAHRIGQTPNAARSQTTHLCTAQ